MKKDGESNPRRIPASERVAFAEAAVIWDGQGGWSQKQRKRCCDNWRCQFTLVHQESVRSCEKSGKEEDSVDDGGAGHGDEKALYCDTEPSHAEVSKEQSAALQNTCRNVGSQDRILTAYIKEEAFHHSRSDATWKLVLSMTVITLSGRTSRFGPPCFLRFARLSRVQFCMKVSESLCVMSMHDTLYKHAKRCGPHCLVLMQQASTRRAEGERNKEQTQRTRE